MKHLADRAGIDFATGGEREHRRVGRGGTESLGLDLKVLAKHKLHPWTKGHEPALVEFGLSDHQKPTLEIHVSDSETTDFTDAQA
jgi:hypothetical protein